MAAFRSVDYLKGTIKALKLESPVDEPSCFRTRIDVDSSLGLIKNRRRMRRTKVCALQEYIKTKGPALDLSNTDLIHGDGIAIYLRNVEELSLDGTLFEQGCDEFWSMVSSSRVLRTLRTLRLAGAHLTPGAADGLIRLLQNSASISSLDISGNPNLGDDAGRKILAVITPRITHLNCEGCGFSHETCCLITSKKSHQQPK
ncbi:hypothetical protein Pelo_602 [Pelomyxa schiedti]|nr:hypothetical protein Pelo_602 [Pelomyxa schiedti]